MGLVVVAGSPLVAAFYREPQVIPVLNVLALSFPVASLGTVPQSLLVRNMEYRRLAIIEISAASAAAGAAMLLAWAGAGVWSLVAAALINATITTILSFVLSGWRAIRGMEWAHLRAVSSYGLNLSGFVIINYFARNAGHLLVGRSLGREALGYYQMAYTLMAYPLQNVTGVLGRVLFSAFARLQEDHERFRSACTRALTVIAALCFPILLGLMVTAEPLIRVFLGGKWLPVIPLAMVLVPVGLTQCLISPLGQVYLAKGRADLMFRIGLLSSSLQIAGYWGGLHWGLQGVVGGYAVANVILLWPALAVPFGLIGLRFRTVAGALAPVAALTLLMAAAALGWRLGFERWGTAAPLPVLTSTAAMGVLAYVLLMLWLRPAVLGDLLQPLAGVPLAPLRRLVAKYTGQPA
jgi:PST family polysaccharide transporter